jgi:hypothetical protein
MSDDAVRGMTVNERLVHFGLVAAFAAAVRSGDLEAVVAVLSRAQLGAEQAQATARSVLANPQYYGF